MKAQRVLLNQIDKLEFKRGQRTTGRRLNPIQQLTCVGLHCQKNLIESVVCDNINQSGSEPEWHCTAQLPSHLKLGKTRVSCEGYDDSSDPFVLIGSCGLKYELKQKFLPSPKTEPSSNSSIHPTLLVFSVVFVLTLLIVLFKIIGNWRRNNGAQNQDNQGNSNYDAPPDYDTATSSIGEDYQRTTQPNESQSNFRRWFPNYTSYRPRNEPIIINNITAPHCDSRPQFCRTSSSSFSQTNSNCRTNSTSGLAKSQFKSKASDSHNNPLQTANFSPSTETRSSPGSSSVFQSSHREDSSSSISYFSPSTETR